MEAWNKCLTIIIIPVFRYRKGIDSLCNLDRLADIYQWEIDRRFRIFENRVKQTGLTQHRCKVEQWIVFQTEEIHIELQVHTLENLKQANKYFSRFVNDGRKRSWACSVVYFDKVQANFARADMT